MVTMPLKYLDVEYCSVYVEAPATVVHVKVGVVLTVAPLVGDERSGGGATCRTVSARGATRHALELDSTPDTSM